MRLQRFHRSRDAFEVGGFGPGVANTFDLRLKLDYNVSNESQLKGAESGSYDPYYGYSYDDQYDEVNVSWCSLTVPESQQRLNFFYAGSHRLLPQDRRRVKDLELFDAQMQPVAAIQQDYMGGIGALNFPTARFARVNNWNGTWFLFELFLGEADSNWDPAMHHPTDGRIVATSTTTGTGYDVLYRSWTQTEIDQSPSRQWQIETVTDNLGNQLGFTYSSQPVGGSWVITEVALPGGDDVQYRYAGPFLNEIEYPDGSIGSFTYAPSPNGGVEMTIDDLGADPTHRHKTVIMGGSAGTIDGKVVPTAVGMCKLVLNGEDEVTFIVMPLVVEEGTYQAVIYEGGGQVRSEVNTVNSNGSSYLAPSRYYEDGWRLTFDDNDGGGNSWDTLTIIGDLEQNFSRYDGSMFDVLAGKSPKTIDARGVVEEHSYDMLDNRIQTDHTDGTFETWCYQSGTNWITRHRDRNGNVTRTTYNVRGQVLTLAVGLHDSPDNDGTADQYGTVTYNRCATDDVQTDAHAVTTYQYHPVASDAKGQLASVTDAEGEVTSYAYDNLGRLVTTTLPPAMPGDPAAVYTRSYDTLGRLSTVTDPLGHVTQYFYDWRHRLISTLHDDGTTDRVVYHTAGSQAGLVQETIDRLGVVTTYQYDSADRLLTKIDAAARVQPGSGQTPAPEIAQTTTYEYLDGTFKVRRSITASAITAYTYDYKGRRVRTEQSVASTGGTPKKLTTRMIYQDNYLVGTEDPYGRETFYAYDATDGRLIRTVQESMPQALSLAARQDEWKPGLFDVNGDYVDVQGRLYRLQTNGSYIYTNVAEDEYDNTTYTFTPGQVVFSGDYMGNNGSTTQNPDWGPFYDLDQAGPPPPAPAVALIASSAELLALERDLTPNAPFVITDQVRDAEGNVTTQYDERLTKTEHEYDSRDRRFITLVAVGMPVEARTETDYDAVSRVVEVRGPRYFDASDAEGHQKAKEQWTYTATGKVASHTEAPGTPTAATESFTYDLSGRQITKTDFAGQLWSTIHDECCGQTVVSSNPLGDGRITRSDAEGRTIHSVMVEDTAAHSSNYDDPINAKTLSEVTTRYDGRGRPVARTTWLLPRGLVDATDPPIAGLGAVAASDGLTTQYVYDDNVTDSGIGFQPVIAGTPSPDLSAAITKLGDSAANGGAGVTFTAESPGSARATINPQGEVSFSLADGAGRTVMSGQLDPNDNSLITWNCTVHDQTEVVDGGTLLASVSVNALGNSQKVLTDGIGRTIRSVDAAGKITSSTFDAAGNRLSVTDPSGVGQTCVYDAMGRDVSCTDTAGAVTSMAYDMAGNKVASTDAKSNTTTYTFDVRGRQVKQTDRIGGQTLFAYTPTGQLQSLTDAQSQVTSYTYDAAGTKLTEVYPDHIANASIGQPGYGIVSFTPDATGRTVQRTDQQGDTCDFDYDLAGRLSSKTYVGHATGPLAGQGHTDSFTYDGASRMLTAVSGRYANTVTYSYDPAGRKATEGFTHGGQSYVTTTDYDSAGQVSSLTYPDGSVIGRDHTARGQLASITRNNAAIDTRTYDDSGRIASSTYGNGVAESRSYNADNTLSSIAYTGASIGNLSYGWDANKNKTSESITGSMSGYGFNTTGYDSEDRLTAWTRSDNQLTKAWNLSLVGDWDSVTENGTPQTRTHGPTHELLSAAGQFITHDAKGNQSSIPAILRHSGPSPLNLSPLTLSWDFENKLVSSDTDADGIADVSYVWDALLRRVGRTDASGTTLYVQSGQQTIADYALSAASASPTFTYAYGSYVDEPVARWSSTGVVYYHRTQQYSITALTDAAGQVVERYAYTAYGEPTILDASLTVLPDSAVGNRYLYTGREWDGELGLYHYRARMYSADSGRFVSRDPIGFNSTDTNIYRFVFNQPLVQLDPSGLKCTVYVPITHGPRGPYIPDFDSTVDPLVPLIDECDSIGPVCCWMKEGKRRCRDKIANPDVNPIPKGWPEWDNSVIDTNDSQDRRKIQRIFDTFLPRAMKQCCAQRGKCDCRSGCSAVVSCHPDMVPLMEDMADQTNPISISMNPCGKTLSWSCEDGGWK